MAMVLLCLTTAIEAAPQGVTKAGLRGNGLAKGANPKLRGLERWDQAWLEAAVGARSRSYAHLSRRMTRRDLQ